MTEEQFDALIEYIDSRITLERARRNSNRTGNVNPLNSAHSDHVAATDRLRELLVDEE